MPRTIACSSKFWPLALLRLGATSNEWLLLCFSKRPPPLSARRFGQPRRLGSCGRKLVPRAPQLSPWKLVLVFRRRPALARSRRSPTSSKCGQSYDDVSKIHQKSIINPVLSILIANLDVAPQPQERIIYLDHNYDDVSNIHHRDMIKLRSDNRKHSAQRNIVPSKVSPDKYFQTRLGIIGSCIALTNYSR